MVQNTAIRDDFEEEFMKWGAAIINYCKECQAKNSALQAAINITDLENTGICILQWHNVPTA